MHLYLHHITFRVQNLDSTNRQITPATVYYCLQYSTVAAFSTSLLLCSLLSCFVLSPPRSSCPTATPFTYSHRHSPREYVSGWDAPSAPLSSHAHISESSKPRYSTRSAYLPETEIFLLVFTLHLTSPWEWTWTAGYPK